jgi:hypothetical protein
VGKSREEVKLPRFTEAIALGADDQEAALPHEETPLRTGTSSIRHVHNYRGDSGDRHQYPGSHGFGQAVETR